VTLVLADDLTGALEAGAVLVSSGIPAVVTAGNARSSEVQGLVIDTETRHESAESAARRVEELCVASTPGQFRLVYKKTD
jgi:uncharacterized protein YgbK (DUF1537 family)